MGTLWREPETIRVVAPAGPADLGDLDAGMALLKQRGFEVTEGAHLRRAEGYLAGSDRERLADLQEALNDPEIDAVWFARGGYGTQRLLPALRVPELDRPKFLIGFSDATALFLWALRSGGFRLLYAPSLQELARPGVCDLEALWAALRGEPEPLPAEGPLQPAGPAEVVGGCLTLLSTACGTPWRPRTRGRFLFLEDVGERLYRVDRMLTHLHQAGWFEGLAGILLGSFTGMGEGESAGAVAERARALLPEGIPVIGGLPAGHRRDKRPLPMGLPAFWDGSSLRFPRP
jgi:muramoyltetrapeptide carboxypeptidase